MGVSEEEAQSSRELAERDQDANMIDGGLVFVRGS